MDNGQIAGLSNQKIKIFLLYDLNSIIQNNNILEHLFGRIIEKLRLISVKYRFIVVNATFSTIFQLYCGLSFTGGGNQITKKKPPTCR